MNYYHFHMSRIGASHIARNLPCQDASFSDEYRGTMIAVTADGHGNRRHFRSHKGAEIACRIAADRIKEFLDSNSDDGSVSMVFEDDQIQLLKQNISISWFRAVMEDYDSNPWTDEELEEEKQLLNAIQFERLKLGIDATLAYGSTLCAVFFNEYGWVAIQLGDGAFVHIAQNGQYSWPMPKSYLNEGNRTASLCLNDPMVDFRHCHGSDLPAGLFVYTDGIEKVFPPQGKEVTSLLHWIWKNERANKDEGKDNLSRTLDQLTQKSPIGDDIGIAGIVDCDAPDIVPILSLYQKKQELENQKALIDNLEKTIAYHKQQLRQSMKSKNNSRSDIIERLDGIIKREEEELEKLFAGYDVLLQALPPEETEIYKTNRTNNYDDSVPGQKNDDKDNNRLPDDDFEDDCKNASNEVIGFFNSLLRK